MMNDEHKRLMLAVLLSGIVLFGWQYFYVLPNTPQQPVSSPDIVQDDNSSRKIKENVGYSSQGDATLSDASGSDSKRSDQKIETFEFSNQMSKIQVTSDLSILWDTTDYASRSFGAIVGSENPLNIFINGKKARFELTHSTVRTATLTGLVPHEGIELNIELKDNGKLLVTGTGFQDRIVRFQFQSTPITNDYYHTRKFVYYKNKLITESIDDSETDDGMIRFFGVDYDYHLFSINFTEHRLGKVRIDNNQMTLQFLSEQDEFSFQALFTKKDYDRLVDLGNLLHNSVDFGFFSILAVPILRLLQFFYELIPNYGIAIILLTLVIRFVTFPLQLKSLKSMKKMQKIQPDLAKIREKFKDDPQKLQKESMELFKRSGANPVSGCFPLLLQMPIFFAFYQMLSHAVELVEAPFVLWITDLSIKDPYYVLPVLMAGAMFVQQKITPNMTTDPMQRKVLLFMPLILVFIMKDLASGLNLYIFVSTLLGIIQQILVFNKIK